MGYPLPLQVYVLISQVIRQISQYFCIAHGKKDYECNISVEPKESRPSLSLIWSNI